MAKENIVKFFDTAMTDATLAGAVSALATESGYDFTAEEILELGAVRPLYEAETEAAAGGGGVLLGYFCKKCERTWTSYEWTVKCPNCGNAVRGFIY